MTVLENEQSLLGRTEPGPILGLIACAFRVRDDARARKLLVRLDLPVVSGTEGHINAIHSLLELRASPRNLTYLDAAETALKRQSSGPLAKYYLQVAQFDLQHGIGAGNATRAQRQVFEVYNHALLRDYQSIANAEPHFANLLLDIRTLKFDAS